MTFGGMTEPTAFDAARDAFLTGLEHLIKLAADGSLGQYDDVGFVGFMQEFEQARNRLSLIDHQIIADAERRDLPTVLCQGSMRRVLTSVLRVSKREAAGRVRAAEAVGPRLSMLGEVLAPVRPVLAAAQRDGAVSAEKVVMIVGALDKVDRRGFDPADIAAGEALLTEHAALFPPEDLRLLADRIVDAIDPDGTVPNDQLNEDRRYFHLRATRDGAYVGDFRLTGAAGAKLKTLLDPLAKLRIDPSGAVDSRTHGQRLHDALEDVCDRQLRAGDVPDTGGIPATVIVTIDAQDLIDRVGHGRTADGTVLPTGKLLQLANNADIIPAVLTAIRGSAGSGPEPADRQPAANPGLDRPRRRLLVPRLRPPTAILRAASHPDCAPPC